MARLSLSLLGPFQATLDGEPITGFATNKARALLAYLAVEQTQSHPRSTLAGLLWPDWPERSALANLRNALANLRTAIGDRGANEVREPFLLITRETIQFNAASDHWIDAAVFGELAQADLSANDPLEKAIALYRGPFMDSFSVGDSAAYEDWMSLNRERLQRQMLAAFQRLVKGYEGQSELGRACETAWRWVELAPWQESAHQALMRLLALSGQRGAALAHYEACRTALREELDVEPGEETQRLYERIRSGDLGRAHSDPAQVLEQEAEPRLDEQIRDAAELRPVSALPAHNLPAELTPFVGRKELLSEIIAKLQDPDCRLLTLVGPGGSGKTRLARQAAKAFLTRGAGTPFEDGLFFVPLAPLRSSEGVVPTIASVIGFSFYEGGTPKQQLLDYLRHKRALIVLDNVEHLLASPQSPQGGRGDRVSTSQGQRALPPSTAEVASLVLELLRAASGVKILVTSRSGLNVRGEHLLPIEGMHYPESLPERAAELDRYSAVQLFLASAREIQPGFEPTSDEMEHVIRICQLVEGMPLALLLAAAWMKMLTPAEIVHELESKAQQAIDFLATDWRDVPERQRSMRAVFDHSWDLLGEREQKVLQGLSVFRGGFAHQAAKQVADASLRDLMTLINRSLLHRAHTGRYEIHELLRQYAAEKLEQSPRATQAVRDRHSVYYAVALQQWGKELIGPRQQAALAEMDVEIENARAAWDWAAERGQVERLDQGMEGLCRFYRQRLRREEGETAYRLAADRLALATSGDELRVLAKVLAWQGSFNLLHSVGHLELAGQLLRQSLDLLDDPALAGQDTRAEKALVLWRMGRRWDLANDLGIAQNLRAEWAAPFKPPTRAQNKPFQIELGRSTLASGEVPATSELYPNDFAKARRLYEQSLRLYRALGDRWEMATVLRRLGWIAWDGGDTDGGRQAFEESLALRRALGDQRGIAESLYSLGTIAAMQGRFEEAERLVREAFAICQQGGDRRGVARGLGWLGYIRLMRGEFAEGQSLLEEGVAICDDLGDRYYLGLWNGHLGETKVHLGRYEEARTLGKMCLSLARDIGVQEQIAYFLVVLGQVELAEEAYAQAHPLLGESLATFQEVQRLYGCGTALATLTYAARGLGQRAQAWTHLCQALRIGQAGYVELLAIALPAIALLLADRGEAERAVELYALASRYAYVANSRWFEDVAGRHIAAAAEELPPDAIAAAQERGQARDLWATVQELLVELGE